MICVGFIDMAGILKVWMNVICSVTNDRISPPEMRGAEGNFVDCTCIIALIKCIGGSSLVLYKGNVCDETCIRKPL